MQLILHPFELKLKHTFKIAHGERDTQPSLIVELEDGGVAGFGEAAANAYFGIHLEEMMDVLIGAQDEIQRWDIQDGPFAFWETMRPYFGKTTFPQCALDIAAHDLYGKKVGKPLYSIWGLNLKNMPTSNYTIGMDTMDKMIAKIKEMPWPIYKIKLGTADDVEIVKSLRKHTDALFRVDANCAWNVQQTIENAKVFKRLNVEFIEQPLLPDDLEGMKEVMKYTALPIIADESCIREEDVARCAAYFNGVNIKLTKCGGLTPALRMIKKARELNLKVMVGCMTESTIGISAIAHLLPLLDYVDMDGAMLLEKDIATGVKVTSNGVVFSKINGTGALLI